MSKEISFSKSVNLLFNPCVPQKYLPPVAECVFDKSDDAEFIITREIKDKVVKTGDGEDDFVIEHKVVETERINRQEYIDSFKDDVGILNIMKKVSFTGDVSLFNERVRASVELDEDGREKVVDVSQLNDPEAVKSMLMGMSDVLKNMPADLREAIMNLQGEELEQFIKNYGSQPDSKTDNKEGE